jgi:tight adherence protein C
MNNNKIINRVYQTNSYNKIKNDINFLDSNNKISITFFIFFRIITSLIIFFSVLYLTRNGYVYALLITITYYYLIYYIMIKRKLNDRIKKLNNDALEFFEILALSLESGSNLELAIIITSENIDSDLSSEFKRVIKEVKFGKSLNESLKDMNKRIPSDILNTIILNIIESSNIGSSVLDTLYSQIELLRDRKLLEIREEIAKIPTKISIISVLLFIPLLLLLILSPVIIKLLFT